MWHACVCARLRAAAGTRARAARNSRAPARGTWPSARWRSSRPRCAGFPAQPTPAEGRHAVAMMGWLGVARGGAGAVHTARASMPPIAGGRARTGLDCSRPSTLANSAGDTSLTRASISKAGLAPYLSRSESRGAAHRVGNRGCDCCDRASRARARHTHTHLVNQSTRKPHSASSSACGVAIRRRAPVMLACASCKGCWARERQHSHQRWVTLRDLPTGTQYGTAGLDALACVRHLALITARRTPRTRRPGIRVELDAFNAPLCRGCQWTGACSAHTSCVAQGVFAVASKSCGDLLHPDTDGRIKSRCPPPLRAASAPRQSRARPRPPAPGAPGACPPRGAPRARRSRAAACPRTCARRS